MLKWLRPLRHHPCAVKLSRRSSESESGAGAFEVVLSIIQIRGQIVLEARAVGTKIFDANGDTKIGVFDVASLHVPEGEVESGS